MTKATASIVNKPIRSSRFSTSKVQRGGTKKKLKAVTAAKAQARDGTQGRV